MKKYSLNGEKRTQIGRKVKKMRQAGKLPGTVYGKNVKSETVAVNYADFKKVYSEAGETGLVELKVNGEVKPVLIHNVQVDALSGLPLHAEFYQVDLKQKVHANVPVEFIGESPAVHEKQGVLLTILDEIEVEALPTDLPEKLEVDVSELAAVGQEIKVSDLKVPTGVAVLTEPELTVVKVGALVTKEAEAEAAAEAAAAAAAAAEAAAAAPAAEGAAPAPEAAPQEAAKVPAEEKKE